MHCAVCIAAEGRDVIVPAFPETLLLSQWTATKAILGKNATNRIPGRCTVAFGCVHLQAVVLQLFVLQLQAVVL